MSFTSGCAFPVRRTDGLEPRHARQSGHRQAGTGGTCPGWRRKCGMSGGNAAHQHSRIAAFHAAAKRGPALWANAGLHG
jgi:hypothetical protein